MSTNEPSEQNEPSELDEIKTSEDYENAVIKPIT